MATKGMDRVSISVSSLEDSLAFYRDWIGMEVIAEHTLDPAEIRQLWNLPEGTEALAAFLKN
jgi:catechol 2,3-dioxygenase-like lactoylglutathione lyase family enzyme